MVEERLEGTLMLLQPCFGSKRGSRGASMDFRVCVCSIPSMCMYEVGLIRCMYVGKGYVHALS